METRGAVGSRGRPAGTKKTSSYKGQRGASRVPPGQPHPDVGPYPGSGQGASFTSGGKNQQAANRTAPLVACVPCSWGQSAPTPRRQQPPPLPAAAVGSRRYSRTPPVTAPAPPGTARRCGSDGRTKGRAGAKERRRQYRAGGTLRHPHSKRSPGARPPNRRPSPDTRAARAFVPGAGGGAGRGPGVGPGARRAVPKPRPYSRPPLPATGSGAAAPPRSRAPIGCAPLPRDVAEGRCAAPRFKARSGARPLQRRVREVTEREQRGIGGHRHHA